MPVAQPSVRAAAYRQSPGRRRCLEVSEDRASRPCSCSSPPSRIRGAGRPPVAAPAAAPVRSCRQGRAVHPEAKPRPGSQRSASTDCSSVHANRLRPAGWAGRPRAPEPRPGGCAPAPAALTAAANEPSPGRTRRAVAAPVSGSSAGPQGRCRRRQASARPRGVARDLPTV
jgi:hypothetical protein